MYLFAGNEGDLFIFGTPPTVFLDKNLTLESELAKKALVRIRSVFSRSRPKAPPTHNNPKPTPAPKVETPKPHTLAPATVIQNTANEVSSSNGNSSMLNGAGTLIEVPESCKFGYLHLANSTSRTFNKWI